jgi:hypothetical protein
MVLDGGYGILKRRRLSRDRTREARESERPPVRVAPADRLIRISPPGKILFLNQIFVASSSELDGAGLPCAPNLARCRLPFTGFSRESEADETSRRHVVIDVVGRGRGGRTTRRPGNRTRGGTLDGIA